MMSRVYQFLFVFLCVVLAVSTPVPDTSTQETTGTTEVADHVSADPNVTLSTVTPTPTSRPSPCKTYTYCRGENLPGNIVLRGKNITCSRVEQVTEKCCLPEGPHYVCYDITVNGGQKLNINKVDSLLSTDFTGLCKHILEQLGKKPGRHTMVSIRDGGSGLVFRYGRWKQIEHVIYTTYHVENLACEFVSGSSAKNTGKEAAYDTTDQAGNDVEVIPKAQQTSH